LNIDQNTKKLPVAEKGLRTKKVKYYAYNNLPIDIPIIMASSRTIMFKQVVASSTILPL